MSNWDERIEVAAKAAHEAEREWALGNGQSWEECREVTREMRRVSACAALAAADAVQAGGVGPYRGKRNDYKALSEYWAKRARACGAQPADDRRMVDLDAVIEGVREEEDRQVGFVNVAWVADWIEREFGGSAPSEEKP